MDGVGRRYTCRQRLWVVVWGYCRVGLLLEDKNDCEVIVGELDVIEEIVGDVVVVVDNGNGCVDEEVAEFMDDV